jgi:hypothetical protein
MKKASHILGLIGGVLALVAAAGCIIGGLILAVFAPGLAGFVSGFLRGPEASLPGFFSLFSQIGGIAVIVVGLVSVAVGVLALIGAHHVNKNNVKAGVLLLVAGGLSLCTGFGWVITVLCVLAGIFALVKEKGPEPVPPQG